MVDDTEITGKKRVLLVVRWPVGGIRTFLRYVYSRFDPERWHFTILAPKHPEIEVLADDLNRQDVDFVLTDSNPSALIFGFAVFKQLLTSRYDLVHSHGFTSAICSTPSCTLLFKKHLITSHDVLNAEQFAGARGKLKRWLLRLFLGRATKIHSVSHDAQANLLSFLPELKKEKCIVIPNGIESERFLNASPRDLCEELSVDGRFLIGFFGRFMNQKGFRYLVDAIEILSKKEDLPKQPLVLAFGGGGFVDRERRDIKSRNLEPYFYFMPFEPDIAGCIKSVDVVAMPSLWEACGLLAMETLVCGKTLIATDCVGLREVVADTPVLRIPTRDAESLALMILKVMKMDGVGDPFEKFSKEAACRYDVQKQVAGITELYFLIVG